MGSWVGASGTEDRAVPEARGCWEGRSVIGPAQGGHVDMETSWMASWKTRWERMEWGRTQGQQATDPEVQELTSEPPH